MTQRRIFVIVWLAALLVRSVYLLESADSPVFWHPIVDAGTYDSLARDFLRSGRLGEGFFWQPFFYPFFVAIIYAGFKGSILAVKIFQIILGATVCGMTAQLGARLLNIRTGLLAGLLAACYAPAVFFDGELLGTTWEMFWFVLFLSIAHVLPLRPWRVRHAAWWGFLWGLSVITRPTFIPAGGLLTLFMIRCIWRQQRTAWRVAPYLAATGFGLLLVILPVAGLNRRVTGIYSFLPYSGGLNLYIGNNPDSARTVAVRPGWAWDNLTRLPMRHGIASRAEGAEFFQREVLRYVLEQPADFLSGFARKTVEFFSSRELPRNDDVYVFRKWSQVLTLGVWKFGVFGFPFGVLFPLAVAGMVGIGRKLPVRLWSLAVVYALAVVLVFVAARYRMPVMPLLWILAAGGVMAIMAHVARRRWRMVAGYGGLMAFVVVLIALPGPFAQEENHYEAEMYYCLGSMASGANRMDEATSRLGRAIVLYPDYADAHNAMGVIADRAGRLDEAEALYRKAAELDKGNATAQANIGRVRERRSDWDGAIHAYRASLALEPNQPDVFRGLGIAYGQQQAWSNAMDAFCLSLTLQPADGPTHYNLAVTLKMMGRVDEARAECLRALELKPDLREAQALIGELP
jgi:Flp pilus assembly protein TadD